MRPADPATGKPVHPWAVECAAHEAFFMGYDRPKVLKYIPDPVTGGFTQQRVLDSHPGFTTNPDTIPLTYDEQITDARFRETAQAQIDMMNALGTAKAGGLQIPREMMLLLQRKLPAETLQTLESTVACPDGHQVPAGNAFCGTCGTPMTAKPAVAAGGKTPAGRKPRAPRNSVAA